jgi:Tfp pilus assembly protein PilF
MAVDGRWTQEALSRLTAAIQSAPTSVRLVAGGCQEIPGEHPDAAAARADATAYTGAALAALRSGNLAAAWERLTDALDAATRAMNAYTAEVSGE